MGGLRQDRKDRTVFVNEAVGRKDRINARAEIGTLFASRMGAEARSPQGDRRLGALACPKGFILGMAGKVSENLQAGHSGAAHP